MRIFDKLSILLRQRLRVHYVDRTDLDMTYSRQSCSGVRVITRKHELFYYYNCTTCDLWWIEINMVINYVPTAGTLPSSSWPLLLLSADDVQYLFVFPSFPPLHTHTHTQQYCYDEDDNTNASVIDISYILKRYTQNDIQCCSAYCNNITFCNTIQWC